jgi:hypothetical protein
MAKKDLQEMLLIETAQGCFPRVVSLVNFLFYRVFKGTTKNAFTNSRVEKCLLSNRPKTQNRFALGSRFWAFLDDCPLKKRLF